jgi:hypothetical protein
MKAFIYLIPAMIFFTISSSSQNLFNNNQSQPKSTLLGNKRNSISKSDRIILKNRSEYSFFHFSYCIAPNEVLFNKHYDKSYVSAVGHEINAGPSLIYTGKKLSAVIQFDFFYQFSKQKGLNENGFQMEHTGFGMKAPKITLLYNFGYIGVGFYYPIPFDLGWYKFRNKNYHSSLSENEKGFLENYNNKYNFSSAREYGISLKTGNNFYLNFGYECRLFYPAYKFLQQQIGTMIDLSAYTLCYTILGAVFTGGASINPVLGAFIFILPEAASFAITHLKKKSINWPFKSESPLYNNSFKISVNFII